MPKMKASRNFLSFLVIKNIFEIFKLTLTYDIKFLPSYQVFTIIFFQEIDNTAERILPTFELKMAIFVI